MKLLRLNNISADESAKSGAFYFAKEVGLTDDHVYSPFLTKTEGMDYLRARSTTAGSVNAGSNPKPVRLSRQPYQAPKKIEAISAGVNPLTVAHPNDTFLSSISRASENYSSGLASGT